MNLRLYTKVYLSIIVLSILLAPVHGFIDIFLSAIIHYMFGDTLKNVLGPASKYLINGPTSMVTDALIGVTPFLNPNFPGPRIENLLVNTATGLGGGAIGAIAVAIDASISNSLMGAAIAGMGVASALAGVLGFFSDRLQTASIVGLLGRESMQTPTWSLSGRGYAAVKDEAFHNFLEMLSREDDDKCVRLLLCQLQHSDSQFLTSQELALNKRLLKKNRFLGPGLSKVMKKTQPNIDDQNHNENTDQFNFDQIGNDNMNEKYNIDQNDNDNSYEDQNINTNSGQYNFDQTGSDYNNNNIQQHDIDQNENNYNVHNNLIRKNPEEKNYHNVIDQIYTDRNDIKFDEGRNYDRINMDYSYNGHQQNDDSNSNNSNNYNSVNNYTRYNSPYKMCSERFPTCKYPTVFRLMVNFFLKLNDYRK